MGRRTYLWTCTKSIAWIEEAFPSRLDPVKVNNLYIGSVMYRIGVQEEVSRKCFWWSELSYKKKGEFYWVLCNYLPCQYVCKTTRSVFIMPGKHGWTIHMFYLKSPRSLCDYVAMYNIFFFFFFFLVSIWVPLEFMKSTASLLNKVKITHAWCWPGTILPTGHPQLL